MRLNITKNKEGNIDLKSLFLDKELKKHMKKTSVYAKILGGIILEDENKIIKNIALYHHEKWNGSGYPKGLKGKNIPFEARVVSIVDCYDALRSKRVYKEEKTHEEVIEILKEESGKSFDPDILNVFLKFEDKFK